MIADNMPMDSLPAIYTEQLAQKLEVGDIVFIHVDILPFRKIARDTGSWTNHVGIVIDTSGAQPVVAESTFPFSTLTPFSKFIARSLEGRVAVSRLNTPLTDAQQAALKVAATKRLGVFYDTGFNLVSKRQFCSRYVREVLHEATGTQVGEVEDFTSLLGRNPHADITFWRIWYLGMIPWSRKTVTPASMLVSPVLHGVFDGYAQTGVKKRVL